MVKLSDSQRLCNTHRVSILQFMFSILPMVQHQLTKVGSLVKKYFALFLTAKLKHQPEVPNLSWYFLSCYLYVYTMIFMVGLALQYIPTTLSKSYESFSRIEIILVVLFDINNKDFTKAKQCFYWLHISVSCGRPLLNINSEKQSQQLW